MNWLMKICVLVFLVGQLPGVEVQTICSPVTIRNGSQVYPPSMAMYEVMMRSGYIGLPQTQQYLRTRPAKVYHALAPFYTVQRNSTSCSLATAAMMLNAITHIKKGCVNRPATQNEILEMVNDPNWDIGVADEGNGVSLDELAIYLKKMFKAYKLNDINVEVRHVDDLSDAITHEFHQSLLALEKPTANQYTFVISNYEDAILIQSEPVGHLSPIGGYDEKTKSVLILDVDRDYTGPYWASEDLILKGMNTLNADETSGKRIYRGYIRITFADGDSRL